MRRTHEKSRFKTLTIGQIEELDENSEIVIINIGDKLDSCIFEEGNMEWSSLYMCEVLKREDYEKTTQEGQIKELEKQIQLLKDENEDLNCKIKNAKQWKDIYKKLNSEARDQIKNMTQGFKECERIFGTLPEEIVALYDSPNLEQ